MKVVYFQLKINEISIAVSPTFDHFYAVVGALNFRKIWGQLTYLPYFLFPASFFGLPGFLFPKVLPVSCSSLSMNFLSPKGLRKVFCHYH